ALTFGTLLSSQGTVASFVLTLSGFPPGFPSVFPTLPDPFSVPFPVGIHFQWPLEGLAYLIAFRLSFGVSNFIRSSWPV
ncbi:hypothetical protein AB0D38_20435, partial [Streptomyces sp. NPDC048279]|uniref:hypothetical protein n=1 Tax=unclassified Streptomyces TaxID=2593676 RepID=UPI00341ACC80